MFAVEPFEKDLGKNRKHYDSIAKKSGLEPLPLPEKIEELHSEGTFYVGLYAKR